MKNPKISSVFETLFEGINPRIREVISGRFGLGSASAKPLTLAAIGSQYGVTRERVRQIEAAGLAVLTKKIETDRHCQAILGKGRKYLEGSGGIAKEDVFLGQLVSLAPGLTKNHLELLLDTTGFFRSYDEDNNFHSFYYLDKESLGGMNKFITQFVKFLQSKKSEVLPHGYSEIFKTFVAKQKVKETYAQNYLAVSKFIHTNPYGDTGLAEWGEIKPVNIRDRIYLILKKINKPLHFEDITKHINKTGFDERVALSPTVHNELIKDERFVLVGRGMYALIEHGYKPGTVHEVIARILKESGPLRPKQISLAVQKERIVKPNTILVNLQNKKRFERQKDGTYRIRRA